MSKKEEKAREYVKTITGLDYIGEVEAEKAYKIGWDEALKGQFRKCMNNKPIKGQEPQEGEEVILLCQIVGGCNDGYIFPKENSYKNGDWECKMLMRYNIIAWMPIPSFDDILK